MILTSLQVALSKLDALLRIDCLSFAEPVVCLHGAWRLTKQ